MPLSSMVVIVIATSCKHDLMSYVKREMLLSKERKQNVFAAVTQLYNTEYELSHSFANFPLCITQTVVSIVIHWQNAK